MTVSTHSPTHIEMTLPLGKVRCMNCAGKITQALQALEGVEQADVNTKTAHITGPVALTEVISTIENLGYEAGYHHDLPLAGLSCGKCVAKLTKALTEDSRIARAEVSQTRAQVVGAIPQDELIAFIQATGYQVPEVSEEDLASEAASGNTAVNDTAALAAADQPQSAIADTASDADSRYFLISGMTCASCVSSVEKAIRQVDGVTRVNVNLAERTALVQGEIDPETVSQAVSDAGYGAELSEDEVTRRARQQAQNQATYRQHLTNATLGLALGAPLMAWGVFGGSMMIESPTSQWAWGVIGLLTLALLVYSGGHYFKDAWKAFRHHRASMDTLVALGTGAAWFYSMFVVLKPDLFPAQARHVYFEASAMILGLITLGHALEAKARGRTSRALEKLIDLQPQTAILVDASGEREVPLSEIQPGMQLRLRPGAKVPVDGLIESGESYLDESMLTGEPVPAHKKPGDKLHAGTMNQSGSLLFRAEEVGNQTLLARIIGLVRQAQSSKPALAKMADTISAIFVPTVMIIAIITATLWYYLGPDPVAIYMLITATTVLIIACPCALGLATPMSVTVGLGRAAEHGILIRHADAMQLAAKIDTVVLDKTGTLTEGKPVLTHSHYYGEHTEAQVLTLAASLEQGAEHPLAKAIVQAAKDKALQLQSAANFDAKAGYGVIGQVGPDQILLGNRALMAKSSVATDAHEADAHALADEGATAIFVAVNGQLAAILGISDPLRQDSKAAVTRLKDKGIDVIMLTGDTERTAKAIARQAGIDRVIAGVLPDGKSEQVASLQQSGKHVAMVGDGINDAPALAQAEIGIAMGSGSDVAIESAQLTLVRHSLHGVADALELSSATLRNMKQNLFGAFIYNTLGIPLAAGILFPFTGSLLSPVIAGAAMALSSITVVSNANRLRLFRPGSATTQPHSAKEA
ncbi:cation transporter [Photobacterium sp. 1_MG-2023]|uniref:cation transporter n=1 Tax=Photobacterium sp. 1_MG-2023 TaxID=3062646 RepID=UPI0026E3C25E|nr:copper-translocating P-type ATPase [Photobacterium sp. 1_MG-2023]MDO6705298.1 copper-translocating P-type ATPase [Photobacterium sp. 1_MG-2023]